MSQFFFLTKIFSHFILGDGQERVLLLQKSGAPSDTSFARLLTPFPVLTVFTVCYRIRIHRFREEGTLLSYATSALKDNEMRMGVFTSRYVWDICV